MIAGTSGDAGKTVVTLGLARAWSGQGLSIAPFKKGPDYIDAAWLFAASGKRSRNLDTFLAAPEAVKRSFIEHADREGVSLIEGNRGLHDGMDVEGSHSSAALSKLIECPVVLVQDVTKTTRSAAAFVLGSMALDSGVDLKGVILNRVAGSRHENLARNAIETFCGVPVVGALPKLSGASRIPLRHLGLVTPVESEKVAEILHALGKAAIAYLDMPRLLEIARAAPALREHQVAPSQRVSDRSDRKSVRIAYISDSAFSFYYPENLEALEGLGADLVPVSALKARDLPACDALYIGGGFPETHATALSENRSFRDSLYRAAEAGLPVYAECGGLIYLSEQLTWEGREYPMTGVFPIRIEAREKPQGHGYVRYVVDGKNPFFKKGLEIRGHEFHYTRPRPWKMQSVFQVKRGLGCGDHRDGLLRWNVLGTYLHIHALGCPAWAPGVVSGKT
jgi:cobyrinic acid a,c-diamide synthase